MARVTRRIMGGVVEFEDDDTPLEMRSFNALGKSPLSWHILSRSLHWSAVRLMEASTDQAANTSLDMRAMYRPAAAMLGAYAIETLLKMVIVDRFLRENGMKYDARKTKDFLKAAHHRLDELSREAGLRTNKVDRNMLQVLSRYSVWAGRYPVPMSVTSERPPSSSRMSSVRSPGWCRPSVCRPRIRPI